MGGYVLNVFLSALNTNKRYFQSHSEKEQECIHLWKNWLFSTILHIASKTAQGALDILIKLQASLMDCIIKLYEETKGKFLVTDREKGKRNIATVLFGLYQHH